MFGKIISIDENRIEIENISNKIECSLIDTHIIFENSNSKIVGEIKNINQEKVIVFLLGEFINNRFVSGLNHKLTNDSCIRLINNEEICILLGSQEIEDKENIYIGKSLTYQNFNVSSNINSFFSNHFAVIGNTGSGKSCFVARLFQNLFYRKNNIPLNSNIILFDVYGEYHEAFKMINNTNKCRYKAISTNISSSQDDIVKIPPYFLDVDDLALLLNATSPNQIPILEKTLKLVQVFTLEEEKVINYKNNIIAKSLLDILTSGRNSTQIRDQIIAVLTTYYTKDINLESKIIQPGYIRTIRQCLNIDETGKINTIHLVIEYLEKYITEEKYEIVREFNHVYTLKDLYYAFEFALISEGVLKSDKIYDLNNILKVRVDSLINSEYSKYFEVEQYITIDKYIENLFYTSKGEKAQIVNFNLDYVDDRFAKVLTKIYSKLIFNYLLLSTNRASFPVQIILEEAHRYIQNDTDTSVIGYNIFDRITKEGRKYGVTLGIITQRPSELSSTVLSQCSNYIALRMYHPEDLNIIKNITHSITENDINKLKSLPSGCVLCFGSSFAVPLLAKIDMPFPSPSSSNSEIKNIWFKNEGEL